MSMVDENVYACETSATQRKEGWGGLGEEHDLR
jgi:hypothetical protein